MFVSNLVSGLLIGLPLMIAVGPIAILLLDQGLERGARAAFPAAMGVASADLSFSVLAAVGGTSIAVFLRPVTGWLSLAAVALLLVLAVRLFRTAFAELRVLRAVPAASAPRGELLAPGTGDTGALMFAGGPMASTTLMLDRADLPGDAGPAGDTSDHDAPGIPFGQLHGLRLGAAFYGLTVVNPLTVVLFAAVVVAGGSGAGTPGWAIGMALASLIVHGGWVLVGGALGATIGPVATARMRLGASLLMAALAFHFLLG
jgi:threonine/homoserine/homoserine lactone efflux protein